MTLEQIKQAVNEGKKVYCGNEIYTVENWTNGFHIVCSLNQYAIGLTHKDGITMNGTEQEFFTT